MATIEVCPAEEGTGIGCRYGRSLFVTDKFPVIQKRFQLQIAMEAPVLSRFSPFCGFSDPSEELSVGQKARGIMMLPPDTLYSVSCGENPEGSVIAPVGYNQCILVWLISPDGKTRMSVRLINKEPDHLGAVEVPPEWLFGCINVETNKAGSFLVLAPKNAFLKVVTTEE